MDSPTTCNHDGKVKWFPFAKHVACKKCKEVFYTARLTSLGYVLVPIGWPTSHWVDIYAVTSDGHMPGEFGRVDLADDKQVVASALAAYRHVINDDSAVPDAQTLEHYVAVARGVHRHLFKLFFDKTPGRLGDVAAEPETTP